MFDRAIHVLRKFGRTLLQALTVVVIRWLDTNKMVGSVAKEKTVVLLAHPKHLLRWEFSENARHGESVLNSNSILLD
jgi:hypothetical protein